jgi:hypothetical protein
MGSAASASGLRMAELVGTRALSADLGLGQPLEHVTRSCLLAVRLGELLGFDAREREATYYSALLAWVGCTADSHEVAALFGDDVALRASSYDVDFTGLPLLGFLVRHAGAGSSPLNGGVGADQVHPPVGASDHEHSIAVVDPAEIGDPPDVGVAAELGGLPRRQHPPERLARVLRVGPAGLADSDLRNLVKVAVEVGLGAQAALIL